MKCPNQTGVMKGAPQDQCLGGTGDTLHADVLHLDQLQDIDWLMNLFQFAKH